MDKIAGFFVDFVDFNKDTNFNTVSRSVILYIIVFWLIVSFWVYKDASERFTKKWFAVLLAVLNLVLNFPFLILYLLVRPPFRDEFEEWHEGGVNIPMVNFVGEEGVEMSFEIRIHPKRLAKAKEGEMKIDVSFDSADPKKVLIENKAELRREIGRNETTPALPITGMFGGIKSKVGGLFSGISAKIKTMREESAKRAEEKRKQREIENAAKAKKEAEEKAAKEAKEALEKQEKEKKAAEEEAKKQREKEENMRKEAEEKAKKAEEAKQVASAPVQQEPVPQGEQSDSSQSNTSSNVNNENSAQQTENTQQEGAAESEEERQKKIKR